MPRNNPGPQVLGVSGEEVMEVIIHAYNLPCLQERGGLCPITSLLATVMKLPGTKYKLRSKVRGETKTEESQGYSAQSVRHVSSTA